LIYKNLKFINQNMSFSRRTIREINFHIRIVMIGLALKIMLTLVFLGLYKVCAEEINFRGLQPIRGLQSIEKIPCIPGTNGTSCICPDKSKSDFTGCLTYEESLNGCRPIDCWKWNKIKNQCEEAGKEFMPAIILQSIPLTGVFGSGFGNMGRWDIFTTYIIVIVGGCLFICCCGMGCACVSRQAEDSETFVKLGTQCGSLLFTIATVSLWIWGIVVIANKEVEAPWWDWEGKSIFCPLI
jgi:hypothetical protein